MKVRKEIQRRGSVFITALWITIALTAVVLVLSREMIVEAMAAGHHISEAEADAAEVGVEQMFLGVMAEDLVTPGYKESLNYQARKIGNCYYWMITYNSDDETQYAYGPTDEASKLDINSVTVDMLQYLPNMTEDIADSIIDWRDADDNPTDTLGAESQYYQALSPAYTAKDAAFESVGELMLVEGIDSTMMWGADLNHDGVIEPAELAVADQGLSFDTSMMGLAQFTTVYGSRATNVYKPPTTTGTSTTGGATGGTTGPTTGGTVGGITSAATVVIPGTQGPDGNPLADVNATSTQALQTMLQTYLPAKASTITRAMQQTTGGGGAAGGRGGAGGGGGTTTQTKYKSIWDWAVKMQQSAGLTSADFEQIYPYMTCTPQTTTTTGGTGATSTTGATTPATPVAKINVNTASKAVLMCIPLFTEQDADAIISYRETTNTDPSQISNVSWLLDVVPTNELSSSGQYITGQSTCYSADIVTVTADGRAFKRVKIVVDASTGTPQIVYRRDLTSEGWPLNPAIRDQLRSGQPLADTLSSGSGLTMGGH